MFKVLLAISLLVVAGIAALTYIPSLAEAFPIASYVRDIAAPLAVIAGLAALFVWKPAEEQHDY
jgi:hypothetical protein